MSNFSVKTRQVLAPAKINLFLHVTGRREGGLHELDSLFVFADCGDEITVSGSEDFSFSIEGFYADSFSAEERDCGENSKNLVVRAARGLARAAGRAPAVALRLTKNLPLASGMGGGSADAAAVIRVLCALWGIAPRDIAGFDDFLLSLGADVPACMAGKPARVGGIGEKIRPVLGVPPLPAVLVNPGKLCPTAAVFSGFGDMFGTPAPAVFGGDFTAFLRAQRNDLTAAALTVVPEIEAVLKVLAGQEGCVLSRMSGSGATCFGLFRNQEQAQSAGARIAGAHPDWWVRACILSPP